MNILDIVAGLCAIITGLAMVAVWLMRVYYDDIRLFPLAVRSGMCVVVIALAYYIKHGNFPMIIKYITLILPTSMAVAYVIEAIKTKNMPFVETDTEGKEEEEKC